MLADRIIHAHFCEILPRPVILYPVIADVKTHIIIIAELLISEGEQFVFFIGNNFFTA